MAILAAVCLRSWTPIFTGDLVVFTTKPIVESRSELLATHHKTTTVALWHQDPFERRYYRHELFDLVMAYRWKYDGEPGISGSRGFLPPAREFDGYEAYVKATGERCWDLHPTKDEAKKCAHWSNFQQPSDADTWYVRPTTRWNGIGRLQVHGQELIDLAIDCGIDVTRSPQHNLVSIVLEPMTWDDKRFVEFRERGGWKPPRGRFVPPRLAIQIRAVAATGAVSVHVDGWWTKKEN